MRIGIGLQITRRRAGGVAVAAPVLTSVSPTGATAGSSAQTITLTGTGFVPSTVTRMDWVTVETGWSNSVYLATTYVDSTHVTAVIPADQIVYAAARSIYAENGGAASSPVTYTVTAQPTLPGTIVKRAHWMAGAGRTMNGANVQVLADQSGAGDANRNLSQLTAGAQPPLNVADAAFNGQDTLTMNATWMKSAGNFSAVIAPASRFYYVGSVSNTNGYLFDSNQGGSTPNSLYKKSATQVGMFAGAEVLATRDVSVKHVSIAEFNGASSKYGYSAKSFAVTGNAGTYTATGITLGAYGLTPTSATFQQIGKFAELLIVDASVLTAAEHGAILDYFAGKYGITIADVATPTTTSLGAASVERWSALTGHTINGTGFIAGATVYVNGRPRTTTFTSATQLGFTLLDSDLDQSNQATTRSVTVANGAVESNAQTLTVTQPSYLVATWRADLGRTMNGANVAALANMAGTGDAANRAMVQATPAAQPPYVASNASYNGQPTLTFDSAQWMQNGTWATQAPSRFRYYWVGDQAATGGRYMADSNTAAQAALYKQNGGTIGIWAGADLNLTAMTTVKHVAIADFNGASSMIGYNAKSFAVTGNAGTNLGRNGFTLGSYGALAATIQYHLVGNFAELIIVDPTLMSGAQHNALLDHIGRRYAITIGA